MVISGLAAACDDSDMVMKSVAVEGSIYPQVGLAL